MDMLAPPRLYGRDPELRAPDTTPTLVVVREREQFFYVDSAGRRQMATPAEELTFQRYVADRLVHAGRVRLKA